MGVFLEGGAGHVDDHYKRRKLAGGSVRGCSGGDSGFVAWRARPPDLGTDSAGYFTCRFPEQTGLKERCCRKK